MSDFPRFQKIVLPILRAGLPDNVTVSTWVNDIDYRDYPIVLVRRIGGNRDRKKPKLLDHPVIEMTAFTSEGLIETEELYQKALDVLYDAAKQQVVVDAGHLTYVRETMGMTQFSSLFVDSWRIQGLMQIGIRPTT